MFIRDCYSPWIVFLFALCALGLVGTASLLAIESLWGGTKGELGIDSHVKSLGELRPGIVVPIVFTITNHSHRPVWILGVKSFCMPWGCISGQCLPAEIPAGESRQVTVALLTKTGGFSGRFNGTIELYTSIHVNHYLSVRIDGRISRKEKNTN